MTKDETVGWHHQCSGLEFEPTPGDAAGPWGHQESDTTE